VRFCTPSFFFERFCTHLLPTAFCSKSSLKEGKIDKRWGAKCSRKEEERVQNRTISKKIGGKSAIVTKMGCKIRKGQKDGLQNR